MVTRYGDVYQYEQEPIPLPPHIVRDFDNDTMAITGYEARRPACAWNVRHGSQAGRLTGGAAACWL